jgi:hypothetical protein
MEYFCKSVRDFPEVYDLCMEHRDKFYPKLKANEYLARRYIQFAFDEGDTIPIIRKEVPRKYHHIIKDMLQEKLQPKKIKIAWTEVSKHLDLGPPPYETMKYLHDYSPVGFRGLELKCCK